MRKIIAAKKGQYPRTYSLACSVACASVVFFVIEKDNHNDWLHWVQVAGYAGAAFWCALKAMSPREPWAVLLLIMIACAFALVVYIDWQVALFMAAIVWAVFGLNVRNGGPGK